MITRSLQLLRVAGERVSDDSVSHAQYTPCVGLFIIRVGLLMVTLEKVYAGRVNDTVRHQSPTDNVLNYRDLSALFDRKPLDCKTGRRPTVAVDITPCVVDSDNVHTANVHMP